MTRDNIFRSWIVRHKQYTVVKELVFKNLTYLQIFGRMLPSGSIVIKSVGQVQCTWWQMFTRELIRG